jgi:predicted dehydrogenase
MIGCGGAAGWHARVLLSLEGAQIVALVDPSPASLDNMRRMNPQLAETPAFATTEEFYAAVPGVDAVQIVTPHTLHHPQVTEAIGRGLHVLCEKPLAVTSDEARDIAARAEAARVVVTVSYQRRLDPAYTYMRAAIQKGELGEIRTVSILNGQNWQRGTAGLWRQRPELSGGGMLMDSGSHHVESLLSLAGAPAASVSAVVDNLGSPVDINSAATIRFANGVQGQLTIVGDLPAEWIEQVYVTGTEGILRYETEPQHPWRTGRLFQYRDGELVQPLRLPDTESMDRAWVNAIAGAGSNPSPPEVGVQVAELTEAIYSSAREGTTVELATAATAG